VIRLLALAARILLLLAGLLAAALLLTGFLTGFLTRVLVLLARVLVLAAHSGISLVACFVAYAGDNAAAPLQVAQGTSVPA